MSNIRLGDGPWLKGANGRRSMVAAKRFSLFSTALTEEDPPELRNVDERIAASAKPAGELENLLVDLISLTYLRMQRCNRAEAELHLATWAETVSGR